MPDDVLECDELYSFVGSKKHPCWLWLALCRRTRQIVGWYAAQDRKTQSCLGLFQRIEMGYRGCESVSDEWRSYQGAFPWWQHRLCPSESGETVHIERFNLRLRQRLGRLVRKSLSHSKTWYMHRLSIALFVDRYNRERKESYERNHQIAVLI